MNIIRLFDRITGAERRTFNRVVMLANKLYLNGKYCGDAQDLIREVYKKYWEKP